MGAFARSQRGHGIDAETEQDIAHVSVGKLGDRALVRELRELLAASFDARSFLWRQRAPSLLHDATIVQHQRAGREDVTHGVGEEHFANSGDIGTAIELAGDIEQRIELIDLQRQSLVEALKLFIDAAVVDRGRRGNGERFREQTLFSAVGLASITQEQHPYQAFGFHQRHQERGTRCGQDLARPFACVFVTDACDRGQACQLRKPRKLDRVPSVIASTATRGHRQGPFILPQQHSRPARSGLAHGDE